MLTVFQIITMDSWTNVAYNLMDGTNHIIAALNCSILIGLGSFFMLNLILAVIMQKFTIIQEFDLKEDGEEEEETEQDVKRVDNAMNSIMTTENNNL
jgi:hypothetical protein